MWMQLDADNALKFWPVKEQKTQFDYTNRAWDMEERMEKVRYVDTKRMGGTGKGGHC